jgi:pilus assembly protein FimV
MSLWLILILRDKKRLVIFSPKIRYFLVFIGSVRTVKVTGPFVMRESNPQMMKKYTFNFPFKSTALAVALLCSLPAASALTIERPTGAVVLGQPLDLTVKVTRSPGEEFDGLCAQADVLFGDTQLESSRVSLVAEPSASGDSLRFRVRSNNAVDEPVVSVGMRVGCKQIVSRRFVLLSELPADLQPTMAAPRVNPAPVVVARPVLVTPPTNLSEAVSLPTEPPKKAVSVVRKKPATSSAAPVASRLQLTPIDLSQDWDPLLKATTEMLSQPTEDAAKRQEAAALWRYLNLSPKEMLRLSTQEQELNQLKLMMVKSQQQMQELNQQLQNAEDQRFANPVVYGLAGLLVALLAGLGYFYHRATRNGTIQREWWKTDKKDADFKPSEFPLDSHLPASEKPLLPSSEGQVADVKTSIAPQGAEGGVKPKGPLAAPTPGPQTTALATSAEDALGADLDFVIDGEPEQEAEGAKPPDGQRDFEPSMSSSMRSINTHDMLDVRQQAEFFMTLGQYEEAIDLLQNSIGQTEDANPLVYLDLLKMLHTLSRRTEFDSIRQNFNRIFSGRVPPYATFNEPTKGLEDYPHLCDTIVATWPSSSSIEFMESSMVRGTDIVVSGRVELEAFRDLLMLHAIAKLLNGSDEGVDAPSFSAAKAGSVAMADFADSELAMLDLPLTAPEDVRPPEAFAQASYMMDAPELMLPPTFDKPESAGLDLDLSDNNSNLIDFDPTIFSLDLPESKPDAEKN